MVHFAPRLCFIVPSCIPQTYFLGHHYTGLKKIKSVLANVSLVLECRDFRLPASTRNPTLEHVIGGYERMIVYTKVDLGGDDRGAKLALSNFHGKRAAFWTKNNPQSTEALLRTLQAKARELDSLTGLRILVVGMPNVGKSSLLNALRGVAFPGKAKAAKIGDQAGVTRKVAMPVRIASHGKSGVGQGIFALDSPGISQPFVKDRETMLKVALVQGIRKGIIPDEILADYLLYKLNLWDPYIYSRYSEPTNDIHKILGAVAKRDGKLKTGGIPNLQEAASRFLSQWRNGNLGKHILDDISSEALQEHERSITESAISLHQAKKRVTVNQKSIREMNMQRMYAEKRASLYRHC